MDKLYYVYMVTNKTNSVLYTGVTSDLVKRMYEHRTEAVEGFTKKYKTKKLIYFEACADAIEAIQREKQIKGWLRAKKETLIEKNNPEWKDLYDAIV